MGEKNPKSDSENQEATQKSLPPSGNVNFTALKEQIDNLLKQHFGMTIEEFSEAQRKEEEARREQLKQELEKINQEIQKLMQRKIEIQNELGISKTARTRNTITQDNIAFRYIGNEHPEYTGKILSANAIANLLGLNAYYSNAVNWKEKFKSVLIEGNSGGRNPEVAEKIRENVEVVYL
ncbi:MAG: hypothetical protein RXO36_07440 [Candidatus Nanopusillus acidilobi]